MNFEVVIERLWIILVFLLLIMALEGCGNRLEACRRVLAPNCSIPALQADLKHNGATCEDYTKAFCTRLINKLDERQYHKLSLK
jgi:hypothetical protein